MERREYKFVTAMDKEPTKGSGGAFLGGYQTVWIAPDPDRAPSRLKGVAGPLLGQLREEPEEEEDAWKSYTDTVSSSPCSEPPQRRAPSVGISSFSFRAVVCAFAALGVLLLVGTLFVLYRAEPFEPLHSLSPDSIQYSYTVATAVLLFLWMLFFLIVFVTCRHCPMHDSNYNRLTV